MKLIIVSLLLSNNQHLFAGGTCSKNQVKPIIRTASISSSTTNTVVDPSHDQRLKREKQIRYAVSELALPVIYMLHSNVNYDSYSSFNMNPIEVGIFRDAVQERYNDNIVEIGNIVSDSIERHRQRVHRVAVHQKNLSRRRRLAWRSEDRARFAAFRPTFDSVEEKEESK